MLLKEGGRGVPLVVQWVKDLTLSLLQLWLQLWWRLLSGPGIKKKKKKKEEGKKIRAKKGAVMMKVGVRVSRGKSQGRRVAFRN